MNKTLFKTLFGLSLAILFTSCFPDPEDANRLDEDSATIENYLNGKGLEYRKTEQGVYIVSLNEPTTTTEVGYNEERIVESSMATRYFDQDRNEVSYLLFRDSSYIIQQGLGAFTFGYLDGIVNMKRDEVAQFYIPSDLAYGGSSFQNLPPNSILVSDSVSIKDIRTLDEQKFVEEDLIREYLADNYGVTDFSESNADLTVTDEKVYIYTTEAAADSARQVEDRNLITVSYVGKHLDGTVFDQSDSFTLTVWQDPDPNLPNQVIQGWYDALLEMQEGESAVVGIPSHRAYGPTGQSPEINEFETLIFDITVKSIDTE